MHYEMIRSLLQVFTPITKGILIYTTDKIAKRIDELTLPNGLVEVRCLTVEDAAGISNMGRELASEKPELIIFNTIEFHFEEFVKVFESTNAIKILGIHNVNYWFQMGTRWKIFPRPRSLQHRTMLRLIHLSSAVLVLNDNIKQFVRKRHHFRKPVLVFPYQIAEKTVNEKDIQDMVVIPGRIEKNRRNYEMALQAWEDAKMHKYELCLLGAPIGEYGDLVLTKLQEMEHRGFKVSYYYKAVEQKEFESKMKQCKFILAPIQVQTRYGGINEIYGVSKETGLVYDMIRYQKPGIFPAELKIDSNLADCVLTYKSMEELNDILIKLKSGDIFDKLRMNIQENNHWQASNIRESITEQLKTIRS